MRNNFVKKCYRKAGQAKMHVKLDRNRLGQKINKRKMEILKCVFFFQKYSNLFLENLMVFFLKRRKTGFFLKKKLDGKI